MTLSSKKVGIKKNILLQFHVLNHAEFTKIKVTTQSCSYHDSKYDYIWYHNRCVCITMIYCDFSKAHLCSFCKIIVDQCNSDTSSVISNI